MLSTSMESCLLFHGIISFLHFTANSRCQVLSSLLWLAVGPSGWAQLAIRNFHQLHSSVRWRNPKYKYNSKDSFQSCHGKELFNKTSQWPFIPSREFGRWTDGSALFVKLISDVQEDAPVFFAERLQVAPMTRFVKVLSEWARQSKTRAISLS